MHRKAITLFSFFRLLWKSHLSWRLTLFVLPAAAGHVRLLATTDSHKLVCARENITSATTLHLHSNRRCESENLFTVNFSSQCFYFTLAVFPLRLCLLFLGLFIRRSTFFFTLRALQFHFSPTFSRFFASNFSPSCILCVYFISKMKIMKAICNSIFSFVRRWDKTECHSKAVLLTQIETIRFFFHCLNEQKGVSMVEKGNTKITSNDFRHFP